MSEQSPGAAAAALLAAVSGEADWRREEALEKAHALPQERAEALLPALEEALRDPQDAERRNAARSVLAALAAPGGVDAALERLARLAEDPDADVRILSASALGESGNPEARSPLEGALGDPDPNVAAAAADGLGVLGDPRAVDALAAALRADDPWRGIAAAVALGKIGDPRALPALSAAVSDPLLGAPAAEAVGEIGDPSGMEALRPALERGGAEARTAALEAAGRLLAALPAPPPWLREVARREEERVARHFAADGDPASARLLGAAGTPSAAEALLAGFADPERRITAEAGLRLLPADTALRALLPRLEEEDEGLCTLLSLLPSLPDAASMERVLPFLGSTDEEVRGEAADALARAAEGAGARPRLARALEDPALRLGAVIALGRLPGGACDILAALLDDPDPAVRTAAAEGVARCPAPEVEAQIGDALDRERDGKVRHALVAALGAIGGPAAATRLAGLATDADPATRFAAVRALGRSGAPEALSPLLEALAEGDVPLQVAALEAIGELGDARGGEALARRMDEPEREVRRAAAAALQQAAPPAAAGRLREALGDPDWRIRLAAARALARIAPPGVQQALERTREADPDPLVRQAAAQALGEA